MIESSGERWEILPALTLLGGGALFPGSQCCLRLDTVESYGAVKEATRAWGQRAIAVVAKRTPIAGSLASVELFNVGALAEVTALGKRPCGDGWVAELRSLERVRICEHLRSHPFRIARIERIHEDEEDPALLQGLVAAMKESVRRLATLPLVCEATARTRVLLSDTTAPAAVLSHAMELLSELSVEEQQAALELPLLSERLAFALERLHTRLRRLSPKARRWKQ